MQDPYATDPLVDAERERAARLITPEAEERFAAAADADTKATELQPPTTTGRNLAREGLAAAIAAAEADGDAPAFGYGPSGPIRERGELYSRDVRPLLRRLGVDPAGPDAEATVAALAPVIIGGLITAEDDGVKVLTRTYPVRDEELARSAPYGLASLRRQLTHDLYLAAGRQGLQLVGPLVCLQEAVLGQEGVTTFRLASLAVPAVVIETTRSVTP